MWQSWFCVQNNILLKNLLIPNIVFFIDVPIHLPVWWMSINQLFDQFQSKHLSWVSMESFVLFGESVLPIIKKFCRYYLILSLYFFFSLYILRNMFHNRIKNIDKENLIFFFLFIKSKYLDALSWLKITKHLHSF